MLLRLLLRNLIVLGQPIVKLEIADELEPWEKVILSAVCSVQLFLQRCYDDNSLLLPQLLHLIHLYWLYEFAHQFVYVKFCAAVVFYDRVDLLKLSRFEDFVLHETQDG